MLPKRIQESYAYKRALAFYTRYERFLIPTALLIGVAVDFVTFRTIDIRTSLILLGTYAVVAGLSIAFLHLFDVYRAGVRSKFLQYLRLFLPLLLQFLFGALLSASLVFYWFSGAFSVSWPLLVLIAILMASNELFRDAFQKPAVQMAVYYFALFSFFSLAFPYAFNTIGGGMFLAAGIASAMLILLFAEALARHAPAVRREHPHMMAGVLGIFLLMQGLYALNVIPPIPLSLRDAGVYHKIERTAGAYTFYEERASILDRLIPGQTMHLVSGEQLFAYSAIFAPADLQTVIVHHWEFYNAETHRFETVDKLSFTVTGGRETGYRGYSTKSSLWDGLWRVSVETERGQVLGRMKFRVEIVAKSVELEPISR